MENILLLAVSSVLILETSIIIGLIVYFMRKNTSKNSVYENGLIKVEQAFNEKLEDLSAKYAEEFEAFKFFEKCEGIEIDIKRISTEAQKRALVLSIEKAESAIVLCEASLSCIRTEIAARQRMATKNELLNGSVARLKDQEKFAMRHLEEARMRLSNLTEARQSA